MIDTASHPQIYLAGPTVFLPDPEAEFMTMKAMCARVGLVGVSPLDGQQEVAGEATSMAVTRHIVEADIALMSRVDGALVCLDGFRRAPDMDPGTAFEIGWLAACGKPMCGWTRDAGDYPAKVSAYFSRVFGLSVSDGATGGGTTGTLRDPDGILIHSAGCVQNAMIHVGIERGGGIIVSNPDWQGAFFAAAAALATRLTR